MQTCSLFVMKLRSYFDENEVLLLRANSNCSICQTIEEIGLFYKQCFVQIVISEFLQQCKYAQE